MYGQDRSPFSWSTPPRPRTTPLPDDADSPSPQRHSMGLYYGLDASDSTSSGGFTPVSRVAHSRSGSAGYAMTPAPGSASGGEESRPEQERSAKVNQIVQAFFWKAAMVIIQSRMTTVPMMTRETREKKNNKWFNIELDEQESFREETRFWRNFDAVNSKPPPLIIETYLDTSELSATQALVILDGAGKRWNVSQALENARLYSGARRSEGGIGTNRQIVLERWKIDLSAPYEVPGSLELPVVYKKGIILFRALYSYVYLMPTWKFRRRLAKLKLHINALKIGCRVVKQEHVDGYSDQDRVEMPLYEGETNATDSFEFAKVQSPAGVFDVSVVYRTNCEFKVDDSESLLSSHFINLDERFSRPSAGHQRTASQPSGMAARAQEAGSLPSAAAHPVRPDLNQAYGSLSSFHQVGAGAGGSGNSPISELRRMGDLAETKFSHDYPERTPMQISLRSVQGSKSSLRSVEGTGISRRGSLSFMQPFKSPSLSASPASYDPPPASSLGRYATTPASSMHRQRPSLGTMSPASVKSVTSAAPGADAPTSSAPVSASPKPQSMTRITSSFGVRRPRVSSAASRNDDDNNSSGKASYSSSAAPGPGSGLLTEPGVSSFEEDIQIRDFMSMLADGQKQTLKSFSGSSSVSSRRTAAQLSRYSQMRTSQQALADSLSTSLLLQPSSSSTTASRQTTNVPVMVSSLAFSTASSSPGKAMSPHTPHTPAIPSRLSEGLTAPEDRPRHLHYRPHTHSGETFPVTLAPSSGPPGQATTSPLDIPLSPPVFGHRRSNSMTHRETVGGSGDLDLGGFSAGFPAPRHSASLGSVDMAPQSLTALAHSLRDAATTQLPRGGDEAVDEDDGALAFGPAAPSSSVTSAASQARFQRVGSSSGNSWRARFAARGRGNTPPTGSTASLERAGGMNERPALLGRRTPSWSRGGPMGEDEDLLFDMSDMAGQTRRSLEHDEGGRRRSRGDGGGGGTRHWGL